MNLKLSVFFNVCIVTMDATAVIKNKKKAKKALNVNFDLKIVYYNIHFQVNCYNQL